MSREKCGVPDGKVGTTRTLSAVSINPVEVAHPLPCGSGVVSSGWERILGDRPERKSGRETQCHEDSLEEGLANGARLDKQRRLTLAVVRAVM